MYPDICIKYTFRDTVDQSECIWQLDPAGSSKQMADVCAAAVDVQPVAGDMYQLFLTRWLHKGYCLSF